MRIVQMAVAFALTSATLASQGQQTGDRLTIPFSDPARPGTLKVRLVQGAVTVRGANTKEVAIDATGSLRNSDSASRRPPRADGLRRLSQPTGLNVEEEANVISVTARPSDDGRLTIQVPTRTNLQLSLVNGGNIEVEGVEGDLEINNVNGDVRLANVSGSVVASSVNGQVVATVRQVTAQKPMAFTSLNGEVDVTLPASLKASLKLRSDQGDVYTDFDVQTRNPPPPSATATPPGRERDRDGRGKYRLRVDRSIYGTVNGGGPEIELRTFNGDVFLRKGN
jgi:Putative adhesin